MECAFEKHINGLNKYEIDIMARQEGQFPIRGKLEGVVFYKRGEGYLVRSKGSLTKKRVLKDPAFERSRRASAAFKRAASASGLLRRAMGPLALKHAETRMAGRLCGRMMAVVKSDASDGFMDKKRVEGGDLQLLRGFAWHRDRPLSGVLQVHYQVRMDKAVGELEVVVPAMVPEVGLKTPGGATHYELICSGALIDFEGNRFVGENVTSGALAINERSAGEVSLVCKVEAGSSLPAVLGLGVVFFQQVGEELVRLKEGGCFELVGVAG